MSELTNYRLTIFENQKIRQVDFNGATWFSVSDVVAVLTDSKAPKAYWRQLKKREPQLVTICHGLKLPSNDGKMRMEDCANTEGMLLCNFSIKNQLYFS